MHKIFAFVADYFKYKFYDIKTFFTADIFESSTPEERSKKIAELGELLDYINSNPELQERLRHAEEQQQKQQDKYPWIIFFSLML